jgi:tetratricopeptide (TPR) repeat protein
VALLGTLLRAGSQVRVSAQLVEVPAGTVVWSKTAQVQLQDLFQLQDDLTQQIVESLALPLTSREHRLLQHDVPASPRAYEHYLRAVDLGTHLTSTSLLVAARDLYRTCLQDDPNFAPAWARLGRVCRVMAKYGHGDPEEHIRLAEHAFQRALDINPELSLAHNLYTYFELEELGRSQAAMLRLLERVRARSADPDLFAGLVVALRFCGLLDASLAADRRARRLDPAVQTSVIYTHWFRGDWERVLQLDRAEAPVMKCSALALLGREAEAADILRGIEDSALQGIERPALRALRAAIEGDAETTRAMSAEMRSTGFRDPEGIQWMGRNLARVGAVPEALETIDYCVQRGFYCPSLALDPWLDGLRFVPEFVRLLQQIEAGHREAAAAFTAAGGQQLLGMTTG